ncbi:hypothetical protein PUNSTDRAFT_75977 [Punctularia strigosozonata HHB-11173 SS5]|uniref:Cytochrome b561 domain-containing protein n=1 Tax=Punctularia strigosozonata (strain HHB-11173) TaxID=741275 RepID=R7S316_PUNST|nr:uncharacterized protein PUNSTDRAFT_75977 [Punctularia strigosozonata HHB-11173 SS5]EIN04623.1 hypothetical protein PUNSTDRAFT_75977 [Punctularia strigosozonata HHB-11173 SS5]
MSSFKLPFTPIESRARTHALLSSIGFLILLPLGVLLARYARTFTSRWWWAHGLIQFVVSGPVILAGWAYGYQTTQRLFTGGNWVDTHKKIGLALLVLYLFQVFFGLFVHFLKFPRFARTPLHRPPQNYLHAILGLAILALAAYQVHYGLYTEWPRSTGGLHAVTQEAKHAWLALIIVRLHPPPPHLRVPDDQFLAT